MPNRRRQQDAFDLAWNEVAVLLTSFDEVLRRLNISPESRTEREEQIAQAILASIAQGQTDVERIVAQAVTRFRR
jgi:hypothetical protein